MAIKPGFETSFTDSNVRFACRSLCTAGHGGFINDIIYQSKSRQAESMLGPLFC